MDKLKSVLADKIIEISETGGDNVKSKLEKVNRFRDFANACQALMNRYPTIEDELIKMVKEDDFDTKIASSRVDSVIRWNEGFSDVGNKTSDKEKEEVIEQLENITEQFSSDNEVELKLEAEKLLPQDVEYEVLPNNNIKANYSEFDNNSEPKKESLLTKKNINRAVLVCGIILIVIVVIFIIKFIVAHPKEVLYSLIGLAVVVIGIWIFIKNKKKTKDQ